MRRSLASIALLLSLMLLPSPASASDDAVVLQIGWDVRADDFAGLLQFGLHTTETDDALTVLQLALWRNQVDDFGGLLQLGPVNEADEFYGGVQLGVVNLIEDDAFALAQLGFYNELERGFAVLGLQAGLYNEAKRIVGFAQVGGFNRLRRKMFVVLQLGGINWNEDARTHALFQVGLLHNQVEDFGGLLMLSPWNHAEGEVYGAQVGLFNSARRMTGVQIGVVNLARRLHGLQIGLINFARYGGVLPVSPVLNFGW